MREENEREVLSGPEWITAENAKSAERNAVVTREAITHK